MDKSTARELMRLYLKAGEPLNEATEIIGKLPDAEEQKRLRRPIGKLMSNVYIELIRPIVREYPDLDPDRSA
jgi:hypothetical protein